MKKGNVVGPSLPVSGRPPKIEKQIRKMGKKLSEGGKDIVDAMAFANMTGIGKTVNQHGEELINGVPVRHGGARREGKSPFSTDIKVDVSGFNTELFKAKRSESMAVLPIRPAVELISDKCGRYHFTKAIMYRDVDTKRNGRYREQIVGYGVARRQHGDPKDTYVGEGLAVSRALEDLGYKLGKRSWGKVKHNDDIKVQRKQQKARRQAMAETEHDRFVRRCARSLKVVLGINEQ